MSLTTLAAAVATELDISENDCYRLLSRFTNKVGRKEFTRSTLLSDFSENEITAIIKYSLQFEYTEDTIAYECLIRNDADTTDSVPFTCDCCGLYVNYGDAGHEIRRLHLLKDTFIKELAAKMEEIQYRFLQSDFVENFKELKKRIRKVVPFIGSGVSTPFGLPDWKGMLRDFESNVTASGRHFYRNRVEAGDIFRALDFLWQNSGSITSEEEIQRRIARKFSEPNLDIEEEKHAIQDLLNLESDFYLTTNYDNIILNFYQGRLSLPLLLNDIEDIHVLFSEQRSRLIHVHGNVDRPSSMIVTKNQYDRLYQNEAFKKKLNTILGSYSFLFIGFSYTDVYFRELFRDIVSDVGGEHYIVVPNANLYVAREFGMDNIKIIGLELKTDEHGVYSREDYTVALKTFLKELI